MWHECVSFNLSSHGEVNLFISHLSARRPGKSTGVGFRRRILFAENETLAPGNQRCLDGCKQSSCLCKGLDNWEIFHETQYSDIHVLQFTFI